VVEITGSKSDPVFWRALTDVDARQWDSFHPTRVCRALSLPPDGMEEGSTQKRAERGRAKPRLRYPACPAPTPQPATTRNRQASPCQPASPCTARYKHRLPAPLILRQPPHAAPCCPASGLPCLSRGRVLLLTAARQAPPGLGSSPPTGPPRARCSAVFQRFRSIRFRGGRWHVKVPRTLVSKESRGS
jgi:hypothetical protein